MLQRRIGGLGVTANGIGTVGMVAQDGAKGVKGNPTIDGGRGQHAPGPCSPDQGAHGGSQVGVATPQAGALKVVGVDQPARITIEEVGVGGGQFQVEDLALGVGQKDIGRSRPRHTQRGAGRLAQ